MVLLQLIVSALAAPSVALMRTRQVVDDKPLVHGAFGMGRDHPEQNQTPSPSQQIYVLHVPKCGGVSFVLDLASIVGREKIWSVEGTYNDRNKGNFTSVVSMLRDPREMVLSEYQMCGTAEFQVVRNLLDQRVSPDPPPFEDWVGMWADLYVQGSAGPTNPGLVNSTLNPFGCYWPVDMQFRSFTSAARPDWSGASYAEAGVGVQAAISNMMALDVVGLTEAYQESICLFHASVLGELPPYCNCTDEASWSTFTPNQMDHGNPHSSKIADYPPDVLRKIDVFTALDRQLYDAAVRRFVRDVHLAETRFGMRILCHDLVPNNEK